MTNHVLLIDGHSILNRAFYALPLLANSKGIYTNAVYGFLNIMFKAVEEVKPSHIAVAFDLPVPTFRHKMYEQYKGNRKKMPDELSEQVPLIKRVLSSMDICILEKEGFEADDIIGTEAVNAAGNGMKVNILSGDRDLLQLVNDDVTLILPKTSKGSTTTEIFTPNRVREVYKIGPENIVDLKAMMGDSSDNIPGLPGVGEKTATNIILEYGTLENAYENRGNIKPKKAMEAFRDNFELATLSKNLATIKTDVQLDISFDDLIIKNFYTGEAFEVFKDLGFKNFLNRFDDGLEARNANAIEVVVVSDADEADKYASEVLKAGEAGFYLDIDENNKIQGLALSYDKHCVYIQANDRIKESSLKEMVLKAIDAGCALSTIGFKEQQNILGAKHDCGVFDCLIAAYLIDPLRSEYPYEHIASEYAHISLPSAQEVVQEKITKKTVITRKQRATIAGYSAYAAYESKAGLIARLEEYGMSSLFYDIEMPLVYTLSDMETAGIKMNADELKEYSEMLKGQIAELEKKIYEQAGEEFNIQSPKQLGVILFEKLHLKGGKKTKTGYSTAVDVLEKLSDEAPIVRDILKYRQLAKLKSTYADALGGYVMEDGRIHSHFLQSVTATGRLSSADPNMQNIPIRMEAGRKIRKVFVPKEGCVFIDADYSQIELRILAHLSQDEKLIEAYRQDSDIHRITASEVFGVPLEEVTEIQRRNAKAVNFGIVYGISSFGLSQDLSISRQEAQTYIEKYFETYPDIKRFLDDTVESAKKRGYTTTMFMRRRPIPELKESNYMRRQFGERAAMNSPIQGSAADIIKIAMNNVNRRLRAEKLKSRLILQVHDELLIEAELDEQERVRAILKEEMEKAANLRVDLIVDMNTGYNWDEAH